METMGIFISMYLVIGITATAGAILIKNRPEKSGVRAGKRAA
ncbi:hypothetical protein SAMN02745945_01431 [Peptoclostridium litorale DSM 5388]|uniref:Uncharacterized protein n=1 Tax=Peptoclostridium litorale DSM 5388 TaxID=1121324 RepID=A0A069REZ3_PEPLI|nr:hypothetical protein [Peptoclostridium litorale]KDR95581.1 hypothetical protein CLIT_10c03080 [Peptoclostridium litorale DSM 5388]SIN98742.1 hypothetical protein SAMN02745945_01431 [Peptoclostridium litorale DSM 5388]